MSVALSSQPFIGFPIEIKAANAKGLTKNDWVGVYLGSERVTWDWVKPPADTVKLKVDWLRLCKGRIEEGTTATIRLEFYTGGGFITNGTKVAEHTLQLRNPLHSMSVNQDPSQQVVRMNYSLLTPMPSSAAKITVDGVRLSTAQIPPQVTFDGKLSMPVPRCHGEYEVGFLASNDSNAVLGTRTITVQPNDTNRSYRLTVLEQNGRRTGATAVRPGAMLQVECQGALEDRDEVVIIQGNVSQNPRPSELQHPMVLEQIRGRPAVQIRAPDQEGIYAICLALRHSTGASLPGAFAHLMVSKKAGETTGAPASSYAPPAARTAGGGKAAAPTPSTQQPPPQYQPAPSAPPPAQAPAQEATPDRFLCVVCRDNPVEMVVNPCHHLCVCEPCSLALQAGHHPCPMCRQQVKEFTKVFV